MGYPMQIKINFLCRDSILAAPLCLDLVLLIDAAARDGRYGTQRFLSFFLKSPQHDYTQDEVPETTCSVSTRTSKRHSRNGMVTRPTKPSTNFDSYLHTERHPSRSPREKWRSVPTFKGAWRATISKTDSNYSIKP